jgi:hypothetical protein
MPFYCLHHLFTLSIMNVNGVDSNGVSQRVIDALEGWLKQQDDPPILRFENAVHQRDATEYYRGMSTSAFTR